ncbi:MAG: FlgO family outer membrane protein [Candidatus Paceibacterota bacterium]
MPQLRSTFQTLTLCLAGCLFLSNSQLAVSQETSAPRLLRVVTDSGKILVGQVIENADNYVRFFDLVTNSEIELDKADVREVVSPLDFDDAVRSIGLPRLLSWRIRLIAEQRDASGAIARITPQTVYVTLGKTAGVTVGAELSVYRNKGEIRDPDSGELLAVERPLISQLEVVEVTEKYSKARISSNLEVPLKVGDEVELNSPMVLAVCPIRVEDGELTNIGADLAEEITTGLVQAGIQVVERSVLDTVLPELIAQNTLLFDPGSAKKLGELTGASYVVTGKIVRRRKVGTAYVRLVSVETGEIVLAASSSVSMANAEPIRSGNRADPVRGNGTKLGSGRRPPAFLTTSSRYARTSDGGIRIQGYDEFSIKKQGAVWTKETDFLDRDFTFEVLVDFQTGDYVANVGLGYGMADVSYNALKDSVYLRIHAPSMRPGMEPGVVKLNRFRLGEESIGTLSSPRAVFGPSY